MGYPMYTIQHLFDPHFQPEQPPNQEQYFSKLYPNHISSR